MRWREEKQKIFVWQMTAESYEIKTYRFYIIQDQAWTSKDPPLPHIYTADNPFLNPVHFSCSFPVLLSYYHN